MVHFQSFLHPHPKWSVADVFLCLECDFEESHLCGYSNQWNTNVNWYVGGGGGALLLHNNIPNDHTYNNKTGEYYSYSSVCVSKDEGTRCF